MKKNSRMLISLLVIIQFIGLPVAIYYLSSFPRRTVIKEGISIATILSFFAILSMFYWARGNRSYRHAFSMKTIQRMHKVIGYGFIGVLLLHPFLIILPRYFEGGISPKDAMMTILSMTDNPGIVFGMIAWVLLCLLFFTSLFRYKLGIRYRVWREFHGILSLIFLSIATFHVISLGRHSSLSMALCITATGIGGILILTKTYISDLKSERQE